MSLADVTDVPPTRRMSVARGTLLDASDAAVDLGSLEATIAQAVKAAPSVYPMLHPVQPTHVDASFEGTTLTVTVQAFARHDLELLAMHGVAVGLLSLRAALGGRIEDLHLVQNVG